MIRKLILFSLSAVLVGLFISSPQVKADTEVPINHGVNIYLFWGDGCPHCAKAKPVLETLDNNSDSVNLYKYEVYYNTDNQRLLQSVADALKIDASGVPVIIVGDKAIVGYSDTIKSEIEDRVKECTEKSCPDSVAVITGAALATDRAQEPVASGTQTEIEQNNSSNQDDKTISLPLIGDIHVRNFSLPILTIIIAALDGFNPCAMWTLLFLISLLLGMKSRRRMWLLGGTFIIASAFVYFLFMTAWLNIFLFIGYVTWVKLLIGIIAISAGGYYLYDFYKNRDGTCKVTGDEKRQVVFEKIRHITHNKSLWIALVGIAALAFAVNLVELVCSAGLPAVYTGILSTSGLETWQYYAYISLYIFVFMLDDLFVFFAAMITLEMVGVHTKYARISHLIGGILMVVLGMLLIFAPQLLMFG